MAVRKYPKEFTNEKNDDETLPIINKTKATPKKKNKGEIQGTKRKEKNDDETLPIINKPKQPKKKKNKGEIQGTKRKDPHQRRQKNHVRG